MLTRIIIALIMTIGLLFIDITGWLRLALYLVVYLIIGYDILKKAWFGIIHGRVFDENFLMAVATVGAFALAIYEKSGDYLEAIAVMLFYQIGEFFQSYAVGKSRRNIAALMDIRPDYANVESDGKIEKVDPDDVRVGQTIIIQPGERVPIDGVIVSGESSLNTSALTGESLPREVSSGLDDLEGFAAGGPGPVAPRRGRCRQRRDRRPSCSLYRYGALAQWRYRQGFGHDRDLHQGTPSQHHR